VSAYAVNFALPKERISEFAVNRIHEDGNEWMSVDVDKVF
jgi:hypothetical protein